MTSTDSSQATPKILIIAPSWVGDMIMSQSLFILLKQKYPNSIIDVMAPPWSSPLLERMPEVNNIIDMPLGHGKLQLKTRFRLGKALRAQHYDQAILLPNSLKSALIPFWANIPKRTGFVGEMRYGLLSDVRPLDKQLLSMTIQRFCALAFDKLEMGEILPEVLHISKIPTPRLRIDPSSTESALDKFKLSTKQPVLALCPGAEYGPAKQWPAKHYAKIAEMYQQKGWQVWIFGSEKDKAIADNINSCLSLKAINLCGRTHLSEAIDLMSLTQLVISNDSGLMHMAASLDIPIVGIYGSSDPNFTPALGNKSINLSLNLDCSPCFKRTCPLGHSHCLENLTPEFVYDSLSKSQKT